ncbi:hypothetical protein PV327_004563 [Microctonus hyperodae]|uniref:Uncharacterized protein n=1 Tax=Microctonus hyperodae TaxID=165561 RepID=A0AA39KMU3_MICHY|nr:hypothetical protein PV327_004563 [Microctonus hyperodae]
MDENNCNDAQSKHTMSFTRVNGTKRKQTEVEPTLFHDHKKKSRYYIKNDSTFNGTALSAEELMVLWNKFKMHGHFRIENNLQNFHAINERNFSTSQFHHYIDSNKSDQRELLSTTTNKFFVNNNDIYNDSFAFETLINNNVTGGEVNNLEKIIYDTSVDMYQEIPSYQFYNQYQNTLYNPLEYLNFMDNSNLTDYDELEKNY